MVKNCGQTVHDEVASKQTMEELKDLLKVDLLAFSNQWNLFFLNSHSTTICLSLLLWLPYMFHEGYVDLSPEGQISLNIEEAFLLKQHAI